MLGCTPRCVNVSLLQQVQSRDEQPTGSVIWALGKHRLIPVACSRYLHDSGSIAEMFTSNPYTQKTLKCWLVFSGGWTRTLGKNKYLEESAKTYYKYTDHGTAM